MIFIMNRKNKYRFWCKGTSSNPNFSEKGWWKYPNYILEKYYYFDTLCDSEYFVACQCTGLSDENGDEIYEGDLLKLAFDKVFGDAPGFYRIYQVMWDDSTAAFALATKDGFCLNHTGLNFSSMSGRGTIVGNIFERPDLLT